MSAEDLDYLQESAILGEEAEETSEAEEAEETSEAEEAKKAEKEAAKKAEAKAKREAKKAEKEAAKKAEETSEAEEAKKAEKEAAKKAEAEASAEEAKKAEKEAKKAEAEASAEEAKKAEKEAKKAEKEAKKKAEAEASRAAELKASRAAAEEAEARRRYKEAAAELKEAKNAAKAGNSAELKAAEAAAEDKLNEASRLMKAAAEAAEAAEDTAVNVYESRRAYNNIARNVGRADEKRMHEAAEYCRIISAALAAGAGNSYIINAAAAYFADSSRIKRAEKETAAEYTARVMLVAKAAVLKNTEISNRIAAVMCSKNQMFKILRSYQLGIFDEGKFRFAKEINVAILAADIEAAAAEDKKAKGWKEIIFQRGEDKYTILAAPAYAEILTEAAAANERRSQRIKKYTEAAEGWKYYFRGGRMYTLIESDCITLSDIYAAVSRRLQIEDARAAALKEAKEAAAAAEESSRAAAESAKAAIIGKIESTRAQLAVIFANCGGDIAKFKKASEEGRKILRQQLAAAGMNEANEAYLIMCA